MTNPVSTIPSAQLPHITSVLTNSDGSPTTLFHRFLTGLWQRTGGAAGVSATDVSAVAQAAQTAAGTANKTAGVAGQTATAAQIAANAAQGTANTANAAASSAINLASYVQSISLLKTNNLSDLTNIAAARLNIGLANYPAVFTFDSCPSGLRRGIPLTQNCTVGANFLGTQCYAGIHATADTIFAVSAYRGGAYLNIGTITFVNSGAGIVFSPQPAFQLFAGDTLVITLPSADATLGQAGVTIPLTLS